MIMDHPMIQHKIGVIRRKETGTKDFRILVSEIAMLMCYEATRDLRALRDRDRHTDLQGKSKRVKRKETRGSADLTRRAWHGRWNAHHDPGGKSRSYRTLP